MILTRQCERKKLSFSRALIVFCQKPSAGSLNNVCVFLLLLLLSPSNTNLRGRLLTAVMIKCSVDVTQINKDSRVKMAWHYESFWNRHQRQTIIFNVTHLLAFRIGFAFKLHPQHWDFPRLKATWRPANRHLGGLVVAWNRWSQMTTKDSAGWVEKGWSRCGCPLLPSACFSFFNPIEIYFKKRSPHPLFFLFIKNGGTARNSESQGFVILTLLKQWSLQKH